MRYPIPKGQPCKLNWMVHNYGNMASGPVTICLIDSSSGELVWQGNLAQSLQPGERADLSLEWPVYRAKYLPRMVHLEVVSQQSGVVASTPGYLSQEADGQIVMEMEAEVGVLMGGGQRDES